MDASGHQRGRRAHLAPLVASAIVLVVTCLICWRTSRGGDTRLACCCSALDSNTARQPLESCGVSVPSASAASTARSSTPPASRPSAEQEELFFPQSGWLLDAIHERCVAQAQEAVTFAEASPWPEDGAVWEDIYV